MRAFIITLNNDKYSNLSADRCMQSAGKYGVKTEKFWGTKKEDAEAEMKQHGLTWTWANNNTKHSVCPKTGLKQHPYRAADLRAVKGCFMSHFRLWTLCVQLNEPILILEHDAVFLRSLPNPFPEFKGICQINDPSGATRRGDWWSRKMIRRGKSGVLPKTWVTKKDDRVPDGLAGNSAYIIKPFAAQELTEKAYEIGVWPNDALMCAQLFPYLQEYYPFITKTVQKISTTTTVNRNEFR